MTGSRKRGSSLEARLRAIRALAEAQPVEPVEPVEPSAIPEPIETEPIAASEGDTLLPAGARSPRRSRA
jgi:hypothetical protein